MNDINDFVIENGVLTKYQGQEQAVKIPESVTSIGDYAFRDCSSLTSIEIPDGVSSIGERAFAGCTGLTSIKIPNGVTAIGKGAFYGCTGLTSIEIPNSVTSIGEQAFSYCTGLTSIEIPSSVASIDNYAFYGCTALTSIEIPNSITSIGKFAFCDCTCLTSIEIPSSVTSIGERAFSRCKGLTSIEIPSSVSSIGERAFWCCTSLKAISISQDNEFFASVNGVIYSKDRKKLIWCLGSNGATHFSIPDGVTSIGNHAFEGCTGLTSIEIPSSVTSIGEQAFRHCTGLTSVKISNSVASIGRGAFSYCTGLTSIEIPSSVASIGDGAFEGCSGLTSVKISNNVTSIGDYTFYGCTALTSVEIPNSVTKIGNSAFYGCKALKNVKVENPKNIKIKSSTFAKTPFDFSEFNLDAKKKAVKIEDKTEFAFATKKTGGYKATLINISTKEKELIFPSEYDGCEVTELAINSYCQALFSKGTIILDKVVIPKTVKKYVAVTKRIDCRTLVLEEGVKTLYECIMPSLKEVYLPASLKVIEKNALRAITSLEKIHIPKNSKLSFIDANAMPLKEDGTVIDSLLPFCTRDGGNVYIPSEDNPYFMLVSSNNKDKININSEIASPSKALDIGLYDIHGEYALTLREIIDYNKKQKKPIFELYEGNEIKDDGIYDENGELICSYDDKVILDYFYYHQGWFWYQKDLSIVPSPKGFGYRGWNYLSRVKKHGYRDWAYVYKLTTDEDGSYNYDFEKCIGYFNILSCKEAFNMIAMIDSECG